MRKWISVVRKCLHGVLPLCTDAVIGDPLAGTSAHLVRENQINQITPLREIQDCGHISKPVPTESSNRDGLTAQDPGHVTHFSA
jgi:hypothetical protein